MMQAPPTSMSQSAYLFLGLTGIVAAMAAVLAFTVLKLFAAAKNSRQQSRGAGAETAFMAAAMEEAVRKLRDEERLMKARAEASERLSSEIVASMTSGLLVVGHDGRVRMLNRAGLAMLGLADGQWEGPYRDVLRGVVPLADALEESLATGRAIARRSVPLTGCRASHLGLTVSPIHDERGASHGVICLFTDLSEVVELEEQLRLKDSLARLGELTAGIAHEFRNGLATIHGYGRLLDLERVPPDFRPYVQGIRDETEALGQVVTNFLAFARPTELTLAPIDMSVLVERAAEEVRADARLRGGDVAVRGHFGCVDGDEVLLRQALSNLCRNALEACMDANVVPRISIEGARDPGHAVIRITVTDNGPGIPPSVMPRVFRPFFTTKSRGTGLGLSLVQKIIVTHNGRVTAVNNEDSSGARFVVTLPAAGTQPG
jgi:signal transduction histidine kinase